MNNFRLKGITIRRRNLRVSSTGRQQFPQEIKPFVKAWDKFHYPVTFFLSKFLQTRRNGLHGECVGEGVPLTHKRKS